MLTLNDLGPSWRVDAGPAFSQNALNISWCQFPVTPTSEYARAVSASAGFIAPGEFLLESIDAFPPGTATGVLNDQLQAIASCLEFTSTVLELVQTEQVPLPMLGDQSAAFRKTYTDKRNGSKRVVYTAFIRWGDFLMRLENLPALLADDTVLDTTAQAAEQRLRT
ncbi:MAG: hypothetical protein M3021_08285, partial [Actinomycetota bacterium]|nr:hypothetical protein [Actinomycetota bacterium]